MPSRGKNEARALVPSGSGTRGRYRQIRNWGWIELDAGRQTARLSATQQGASLQPVLFRSSSPTLQHFYLINSTASHNCIAQKTHFWTNSEQGLISIYPIFGVEISVFKRCAQPNSPTGHRDRTSHPQNSHHTQIYT